MTVYSLLWHTCVFLYSLKFCKGGKGSVTRVKYNGYYVQSDGFVVREEIQITDRILTVG